MTRFASFALASLVASVLGLAGCSSSQSQVDYPPTASPSAFVPMVKYPEQHAKDTHDELIESRYVAGQPVDYVTITGEVVKAVRWADPSDSDYVDFYLDAKGMPFVMTDGVVRCEFPAGTPETIFNLKTSWLLLSDPVAPGEVEKRPLINTINQEITYTCTAAS